MGPRALSLEELRAEQQRLQKKLDDPKTAYAADAARLTEVEKEIDKIENRRNYW